MMEVMREGKEEKSIRILILLAYKETLHGPGLMINPLRLSELAMATKQRS